MSGTFRAGEEQENVIQVIDGGKSIMLPLKSLVFFIIVNLFDSSHILKPFRNKIACDRDANTGIFVL